MYGRCEYRFVLILSMAALVITSIPYALGAMMATEERVFGGFVYAIEDCYSYLAKMRQGAEGAWLFQIAHTPEPHPGALFFLFHLVLGKIAALLPTGALTSRMVLVYHLARWIFGIGLLLTLYRFLATFTDRLLVRRLAWLMATFGGGLGWLLVFLGESDWLGSLPLDFILPEGFTFLVLYAFPHIALGRTLLLWGILSLLRAWQVASASDQREGEHPELVKGWWALVAGFLWLAMGLIVPFYVAVAWAVAGAGLIVLALRERRLPWTEASLAGVSGLISAPIVLYSAWRFTSDPIYAAWAAQNQILSPHPLHYLAAYGIPLILSAFAVPNAWLGKRPTWLLLAWVGAVPFLIYLPFNLQRRLVEGVQVPLSLLAAMGLLNGLPVHLSMQPVERRRPDGREAKLVNGLSMHSSMQQGHADVTSRALGLKSRLAIGVVLIALLPTNVLLIMGNTMALRGSPDPIFRDKEEIAALDWLDQRVAPSDVVLASYETGNYLPARVRARAFVGHGPESVHAEQKRAQVARFFNSTTDPGWREYLLRDYGVDYVLWGPEERALGAFDPGAAPYLQTIYGESSYSVFEVVE